MPYKKGEKGKKNMCSANYMHKEKNNKLFSSADNYTAQFSILSV
jgi:hypothetical protein